MKEKNQRGGGRLIAVCNKIGDSIFATRSSAHKKMHATFYKSLGNTPPVYMKAICRRYHVIYNVQHTQMMMLPCWQQPIPQAGKAVYVLNKLHWLIQIPQSKQYYHMGLSMSKFGYFTIIAGNTQEH